MLFMKVCSWKRKTAIIEKKTPMGISFNYINYALISIGQKFTTDRV